MSMDGQYNSVVRTIRDGEFGAIAVDANGKVLVSGTVTETNAAIGTTADPVNTDPTDNTATATLVAYAKGTIRELGSLTETAPASDTASSGLNGRLQRIAQRLTTLITAVGTQVFGAGTAAAAERVTLASDDPLVAKVPALGTAATAASAPVNVATDDVMVGSRTETAPASDTASSGLNGRLQRIAQRLTSMIALLPASLGSKAASASLSVVQGSLTRSVVAASQTAAVFGGGAGAAGDFLSHVILQPATTGAATTTILDNATVIYTYTAGTLCDLRPIIVPVGAVSTGGGWKVTTGANMVATGFGVFT